MCPNCFCFATTSYLQSVLTAYLERYQDPFGLLKRPVVLGPPQRFLMGPHRESLGAASDGPYGGGVFDNLGHGPDRYMMLCAAEGLLVRCCCTLPSAKYCRTGGASRGARRVRQVQM